MTLEERRKQFAEPVQKMHQLTMENRKKLKITAVSDVDSFSDISVCADTSMGRVTVKGENLKISKLNTEEGELVIDGKINSVEYTKKKEKGNFFENIFR